MGIKPEQSRERERGRGDAGEVQYQREGADVGVDDVDGADGLRDEEDAGEGFPGDLPPRDPAEAPREPGHGGGGEESSGEFFFFLGEVGRVLGEKTSSTSLDLGHGSPQQWAGFRPTYYRNKFTSGLFILTSSLNHTVEP